MYRKVSPAFVLFAATPLFMILLGVLAEALLIFPSPLQCFSPGANASVSSDFDKFCLTQICKENENRNKSWVDVYMNVLNRPCDNVFKAVLFFFLLDALIFTVSVVFVEVMYQKIGLAPYNLQNQESTVCSFRGDETDDRSDRRKAIRFISILALGELICFLTVVGHIVLVDKVCGGYFVFSGFRIWDSFSVTEGSLANAFKTQVNCDLSQSGMMERGYDGLSDKVVCFSSKNKVKIIFFLLLWMWFFAQILAHVFQVFRTIKFIIYRSIRKSTNINSIQLI